jgi:uncharacterized protein (DUF4415 family)
MRKSSENKALLQKRKQREPSQVTIKLWLDDDVLDKFRATGPGWQSRINEALRKARVG